MKTHLKIIFSALIAGLLLLAALYFSIFEFAEAQLRVFTASQGGTGIGSVTAGDVGNCLTVSDDAPFTWSVGTCGSGSGGSSLHASTSANTFIYPRYGLYHSAPNYVATSTATSSFAWDINIASGHCIQYNGSCITLGSTPAWGSITGTLSAQTDLWSILDPKLSSTTLALFDKGFFFSTTSADVWDATKARWATSSAAYFNSTVANWGFAQNYGINNLTPTSTMPVWIKGNLYASSSAIIAGTVTADAFSATNTLATSTFAGGITGPNNFVVQQTTGNVGIGTSSPRSQLEIFGTGQLVSALTDAGSRTGTLSINSSSGSAGAGGAITFGISQSVLANSIGFAAIKGISTNGLFNTVGDLAFSTRFASTDTALTERMRIMGGSGNVGIGTSTPYSKLSVAGSVVADSYNATNTLATSTFSGGIIGPNNFVVQQTTGNVGIGTVSPNNTLSLVRTGTLSNTIAFSNPSGQAYIGQVGGTSGFFIINQTASGSLNLGAGNTTRLNIMGSTGYVGIATTSPYAALSVVGSTGVVAEKYTATGTATSTFAGGISVLAINQTGSATSTFANGIRLAAGCIVMPSGTCLGTGSGSFVSDWIQQTNYGALSLTPSTTIPVWVPGKLYASSSAIVAGSVTADTFSATNTLGTSTFAGGITGPNSFTVQQTSGRLGIGTSSPKYPFTIQGSTGIVGSDGVSFGVGPIDVYSYTGSGAVYLTPGSGTSQSTTILTGMNSSGLSSLLLGGTAQKTLKIGKGGGTGSLYTTFIGNDSGGDDRVAIGTSSPQRKLHVTNDGSNSQILLESTGSTANKHYWGLQASSTGAFALNSMTDALVGTNRFVVNANGLVGIGTSSPYASLSVVGASGVVADKYVATNTAAMSLFPNINGQLFATYYSGSDIGAKVMSAYNSISAPVVFIHISATSTTGTTTYAFSTAMNFNTFNKHVNLSCDPGVVLDYTGTATSTILNTGSGSMGATNNANQGVFGCNYGKTGTRAGTAIELGGSNGFSQGHIENNTITGFATGLYSGSHSYLWTMEGNHLESNIQNVRIASQDDSGEQLRFINNNISDCYDNTPAPKPFQCFYAATDAMINATFEGNSFDDANVWLGEGSSATFLSNYWENPNSAATGKYVYLSAMPEGVGYSNVNLIGGAMTSGAASGDQPYQYIECGTVLNIDGTRFQSFDSNPSTVAVGESGDCRLSVNGVLNVADAAYTTFSTSSNVALFVDSRNNKVGIGSSTPSYLLSVGSISATDGIQQSIRDANGVCTLNPGAGASWSCSSDERLKKNIEDTKKNGLNYVLGFRVRDFDMKVDDSHHTGVIAQELLKTNPELVSTSDDGTYTVEQPNPWLIVKAIQELNDRVGGIQGVKRSAEENWQNVILAFLSLYAIWNEVDKRRKIKSTK